MLKELLQLIKTLFLSLIVAFFIIFFVFESVSVDGSSMKPTLSNGDKLIVEKVTYYFREPTKGEIVVVKYPYNQSEKLIKRIIAVEGDKVKIYNNSLYINDEKINEPYILEEKIKDFEEVKVPEGTIFVLGDNRNASKDSRSEEVGFVSKKLIVGKAALRFYPFNSIGSLYK